MSDPKPPWTPCEVHVQHTDEDCEYCVAQLDQQQQVLMGMQEGLQETNHKLQRMTGQPYLETQPAVPMLRIDVLLAMIFQDPKHRMAYELNVANALQEQMNMVHQHLVRQQITGGVNGMPPMPTKLV